MSETNMLRLSQGVTLINGILVILIAQLFAQLKGLSLFDLTMRVATLLQSPMLVPLFFGMFIRRTPKWAAWGTVCFGMFVSWLVMNVFTAQWGASLFGVTLTARELSELTTTITVAAHLILTGGFFWATSLFYKEESFTAKERQRTADFFVALETPVVADDEQDEFDRLQRSKLGHITLMMGAGLMLMVLVPNPLWGRLLFAACAGAILLVGYLLKRSAGALPQAKPILKPSMASRSAS